VSPKLRPRGNTPSDAKIIVIPSFELQKVTPTSPLSQEILPGLNYLNCRNVQCEQEHGVEVLLPAGQQEWDERHLDDATIEQEQLIEVIYTNLFF
jgi:hypothetical protein